MQSAILIFVIVIMTLADRVSANVILSGPDNFVLTIDGECPGQVRLGWEGATPDRRMALLYADTTGGYVLPHWCDGTQTGLSTRNLRLVAVLRSGAQGRGTRAGQAASQFCGGYLQMIVKDGYPCTTSNVVQIPQ